MTEIYLIRHGETDGNHLRKFTGQDNAALTETGYKQAQLLGEYFKDKEIDAVYSSDLDRAYDTAKPIANFHKKEIVRNRNLREIAAGKWQGKTFTELEKLYPKEYKIWMENVGAAQCVGGEAVGEVGRRVFKAVEKIAMENENKKVAVVAHATPIRALIAILKDGDISSMKNHEWVPNASVSKITYENGTFTVTKTGYTGHLKNLITVLPDNC